MTQHSVSQAAEAMARTGQVSQIVASKLTQSDRSVQVAEVKRGFDDPVMSCFVIDASPSMAPFRNDVIQAQHVMVNTLRGSAKAINNALYVAQWLFSGTATILNPFTILNPTGTDSVTLLDTANYKPDDGDGTALYTTVFQVLQDMAANIAYSYARNIRATFTIGVITDGDDNKPGALPGDIKAIVQELKAKGYINSSVIIGIENPGLSRAKINEIKDKIGFDEAIFVGQSASEIRRAFALASKSAINGQS